MCSYVGAKLGVGVDLHFLWGTYKSNFTVLFHPQHINQIIDQPPKPCLMAFKSLDDRHRSHSHQHQCQCLSLPMLLLRPSILPRSQRNSLCGSTKIGWFSGGGGAMKQLAQNPFKLINEWSREHGSMRGCNNQLGRRGRRGEQNSGWWWATDTVKEVSSEVYVDSCAQKIVLTLR
jgi:hypothetical protein